MAVASGYADEGWKRGPRTTEEDKLLTQHVTQHGEGMWNSVSRVTGLKRKRKSCRLGWVNHLRPDLKRGLVTPHEETIILDLPAKWGNRRYFRDTYVEFGSSYRILSHCDSEEACDSQFDNHIQPSMSSDVQYFFSFLIQNSVAKAKTRLLRKQQFQQKQLMQQRQQHQQSQLYSRAEMKPSTTEYAVKATSYYPNSCKRQRIAHT